MFFGVLFSVMMLGLLHVFRSLNLCVSIYILDDETEMNHKLEVFPSCSYKISHLDEFPKCQKKSRIH